MNKITSHNMAMGTEQYHAGEHELKDYLRNKGYTVTDVSLDSNYWEKDIDLLVGDVGIEVKWDSRISNTGNVYIEYYNSVSKGEKGWFEFCEADYIAYGDSVNEKFYIIPFELLKKYINKNKSKFKQACNFANEKTQVGTVNGYLVPIDEIKKNVIVYELKLKKEIEEMKTEELLKDIEKQNEMLRYLNMDFEASVNKLDTIKQMMEVLIQQQDEKIEMIKAESH